MSVTAEDSRQFLSFPTRQQKSMRTSGVKKLVNAVLASLPEPYTEDVIEDVFCAIEQNPEWRREYDALCSDLGTTVVNTWGGFWIANAVGKSGQRQVPSTRSRLIKSFSKLDAPAVATKGNRKKGNASRVMSEYYQAHRDDLPADVQKHRDLIMELLMKGIPPEEAFAMVRAVE